MKQEIYDKLMREKNEELSDMQKTYLKVLQYAKTKKLLATETLDTKVMRLVTAINSRITRIEEQEAVLNARLFTELCEEERVIKKMLQVERKRMTRRKENIKHLASVMYTKICAEYITDCRVNDDNREKRKKEIEKKYFELTKEYQGK